VNTDTGLVIASQRVARSAPDDRLRKAIHSHKESVDCFVAEFIIGPAEGRTRWLFAMTIRDNYARTAVSPGTAAKPALLA
jgi:hypothetical protein